MLCSSPPKSCTLKSRTSPKQDSATSCLNRRRSIVFQLPTRRLPSSVICASRLVSSWDRAKKDLSFWVTTSSTCNIFTVRDNKKNSRRSTRSRRSSSRISLSLNLKSWTITSTCHFNQRTFCSCLVLWSTSRSKMLISVDWSIKPIRLFKRTPLTKHLSCIVRLSTCCFRLLDPWTKKLLLASPRLPRSSLSLEISCRQLSSRPSLPYCKKDFWD